MFGLQHNDVQECPSPAPLKTHRAHGVICPICEPDVERRDRCPSCRVRVTVIGPLVQSHESRSNGWMVRCPGSGQPVPVAPAREKPFRWRRMPGNRRQRTVTVVGRSA